MLNNRITLLNISISMLNETMRNIPTNPAPACTVYIIESQKENRMQKHKCGHQIHDYLMNIIIDYLNCADISVPVVVQIELNIF